MMACIQKLLNYNYSLLSVFRPGVLNTCKYLHSTTTESQNNDKFLNSSNKKPSIFNSGEHCKVKTENLKHITLFSHLTWSEHQHLDSSQYIYKPQRKLELPMSSIVDLFKLPPIKEIPEINYEPGRCIKAPTQDGSVEKQAARLIVIRRRKMKKHKLKKLRIKMKFEWAKVRQRREMRKEKAFQAVLMAQIKEAEKFDAEKYVEERLQKANEVPYPRTWKGKRLPRWVIKEKLGLK